MDRTEVYVFVGGGLVDVVDPSSSIDYHDYAFEHLKYNMRLV